ncbi:MAG: hypothetical protein JXO72_13690 [Vicinamibacteria bacterium]|nr:hypothetical protein [Vicinamibacteria bacterium]
MIVRRSRLNQMTEKERLTGPWRKLHGAVWLLGLAALAYTHWWWPGILVLVGLSGLVEGLILFVVPGFARSEDGRPSTPLSTSRSHDTKRSTAPLPDQCPKCGAPIPGAMRQPATLDPTCAYCGARLPHRLA